MENIPVFENPELLLEMKALKTKTPAHAEIFNAMFQILLNNDAFLNEKKASSDHTHYIDLDEIDQAFLSVFTHITTEEPVAMSAEDISKAINTPWNGESSNDPNALNKEEIEQAMNTEWNGESSTNPNALNKEEINEAIANASK